MKKFVLALPLLLLLGGCRSMPEWKGGLLSSPQAKSLSQANKMLAYGDKAGAIRELTAVTEAGGVTGITDEALFRLALLALHPLAESGNNLQSINLLKRLKREYPGSRWTAQSGHLMELLAGTEELRRQVRSLKSQNQALGGEIHELNRNIEQLKQLDQELEKRRR